MRRRIGLLASHPIQYYSAWFRTLAQEVDLHVFYAHRQSAAEQAQAGFGVAFDWDIDLLSGYKHSFLRNVSRRPSVDRFGGCDTPEIRAEIATNDFDAFIVCGWYLKCFWQAIRASRSLGIPVFVRGDSQLRTPQSRMKRLFKEITHRTLLRQFDGFLFVGKRNAEYLKHYGVSEDRMFFVPHFVDNSWFSAREAEARSRRHEQRAIWGATEKNLVALFVGKFIPKKRPWDLLRALAQLGGQHDKIIGVFVGSGELEAELRTLAKELSVPAHFEGFKNQSELPLYYASADVLVLPSDGAETWGLVVNEAMACGIPAIVSDGVGCGPDLIEEGKTGFTFALGNESELAARLAELAKMKSTGYDFAPALAVKMRAYSLEAAVSGTFCAVKKVLELEE